MTIGEKIRILRLHNNWTQSALAHLLGVSETTIRNYELDKGGIRERHLDKLAALFRVDKTVLTSGSWENFYDVMQALFNLREEYGLCVTTRDNIPAGVGVVLYFSDTALQNYVNAWHEKQEELADKDDVVERLRAWELLFPGSLADSCKTRLDMARKRGKINSEDLKDE